MDSKATAGELVGVGPARCWSVHSDSHHVYRNPSLCVRPFAHIISFSPLVDSPSQVVYHYLHCFTDEGKEALKERFSNLCAGEPSWVFGKHVCRSLDHDLRNPGSVGVQGDLESQFFTSSPGDSGASGLQATF